MQCSYRENWAQDGSYTVYYIVYYTIYSKHSKGWDHMTTCVNCPTSACLEIYIPNAEAACICMVVIYILYFVFVHSGT
jgi:hypothetical protein